MGGALCARKVCLFDGMFDFFDSVSTTTVIPRKPQEVWKVFQDPIHDYLPGDPLQIKDLNDSVMILRETVY